MINRTVILCGPTHCNLCCPKFIDKGKHFVIEDDYDSSIKLKKSDIQKVIDDINKIISKPVSSMDIKR